MRHLPATLREVPATFSRLWFYDEYASYHVFLGTV